MNHIFIHCPFAREIWNYFTNLYGIFLVFPLEIADFPWTWSLAPFPKRGKLIWKYASIVIIWSLWEERNIRIFEDKKKATMQVIESIVV